MWFKGKSALITGASRGMGLGIAIKLAASGAAKICINYLANESAALERFRTFAKPDRTGSSAKRM